MDADLGELGRRRRRANGGEFSPYSLFANGEQGVWYDPSDLTPEKVSWRRNLLTYSQDFENAAWTKSNASILSNLALYSQDFDNAAWSKVNTTLTANAIAAPDGTTTADKVECATTATTSVFQTIGAVNATTVTFSFYGKQGSGATDANVFDVYNVTTATDLAIFNVNWTTGVVTVTSGSAATTSTNVGSGWWRITATVSSGITSGNSLRVYTAFAGASETAGEFSYLWGAQLVPGSTAQTYTRSLATAAPIQFADPLGGTMADKLVVNTAAATHQISQTLTIRSGVSYAFSAYVKAAEYGWAIVYAGTIGVGKYINLTTGAVGSDFIAAPTSTTVVDAGNGWWRVEMIAQSGANTSADIRVYAATANGTSSYTGDGVSGIYVFGAQVEQASTASAYQRITDFSSDFLAAFPTHALYQESTGVTPVTALGQSVGYVVDKRLGGLSNLGAELVTNGTFASATGWSTGGAWVIADGIASLSASAASLSQSTTPAVVGRTYLVTFTVTNYASGSIRVEFGGVNGVTRTGAGTYSQFITAATTAFLVMSPTATSTLALDNISVREVPGNHALQATSASRPTLQARSNLLTRTEEFDNAAWSKQNITVTANAGVAPDGTVTADLLLATANSGRTFRTDVTTTAGVTYTMSAWLKRKTGTGDVYFYSQSAPSFFSPNLNITSEWARYTWTFTAASTLSDIRLPHLQTSGDEVFVWGAQIELGSTATTYQRVVTATDYADVGLPRNLTFDGVDDSLATAGNVDFTATDKVTLFSGVTKLSDAARGVVAELSATVASNLGSFLLSAPDGAAANYGVYAVGSAINGRTYATFTAPITNVISANLRSVAADSASSQTVRFNAVDATGSSVNSGASTGNFGSYLLYVGRRGGSSLPFNGRLFQLVIRGAATDSVTVGNAERWVGQLTGVAL